MPVATTDLIGFTQAGVGAVERSAESKLRDFVSVDDFGASPSATAAANTTAIQAALDSGKSLSFKPNENYNISGTLDLVTNRQRLIGNGATITQVTDNTPIFQTAAQFLEKPMMEGFTFAWANQQAVTDTNAVVIKVGDGTASQFVMFQGVFRDIVCEKGMHFLTFDAACAANSSWWGCTFVGMFFYLNWRGTPFVHRPPTAAGAPNNYFNAIYVRADIMDSSQYTFLDSEGLHQTAVGVLEVNNNLNGCRMAKVDSGEIVIDVCSDEFATYTDLDTTFEGLITGSQSYIHVKSIVMRSTTLNLTAGTGSPALWLFRRIGGTYATFVIDRVEQVDQIETAGFMYVYHPTGAAPTDLCVIGETIAIPISYNASVVAGRHAGAGVIGLPEQFQAPSNVIKGTIAHADETNWSLGSGKGPYVYDTDSWSPIWHHKLSKDTAFAADATATAIQLDGRRLTNTGATSTVTVTLPAATKGRHFFGVRLASQTFRFDPDGTEVIGTGGAGKYIELGADDSSFEAICVVDGTWSLRSQSGTVTYEA